MTASLRALTALLVLIGAASADAGQQSAVASDTIGPLSMAGSAGWTLTPALVVSQTWDDNVLLRGPGDPAQRDLINVFNPRGELDFNGPRSQFAGRYDGSFLVYRTLDELNSYDQHGSFSAKHLVSPHTALFVNGAATAAPTTELLDLPGVPFVRAGTTTDDVRGGVQTAFTKRLSIVADVDIERVHFDDSQAFSTSLLGGHSVGGTFALRETLSERTTLTADYDVQHATVGASQQIFDIQNTSLGLERRISEFTRVFAAAGVSRLGVSDFGPARTGPSWHLGLTRQVRASAVEVLYYRSFVPSFGFGGTIQNEQVSARLRVPVSRRVYAESMVSWGREEPLVVVTPRLRTLWVTATAGYAVRPSLRIEGFFVGTQQAIDEPGGTLGHNQIGLQIIAGTPVRLR